MVQTRWWSLFLAEEPEKAEEQNNLCNSTTVARLMAWGLPWDVPSDYFWSEATGHHIIQTKLALTIARKSTQFYAQGNYTNEWMDGPQKHSSWFLPTHSGAKFPAGKGGIHLFRCRGKKNSLFVIFLKFPFSSWFAVKVKFEIRLGTSFWHT